ncbi:MAG: prolipoprotein diacylglyceryl transferase [Ignavibacteriae bacterium]|nr:prolipoprotein diacylglyceryl transferase [Ignavibacteriota bacterium]
MYPRLITLGPITIYSFGLMMGIGFFVASFVLHKETVRKYMIHDFSVELTQFLRSMYAILVAVLVIAYLIESGISGFIASLETNSTKTLVILAGIGALGVALFQKKSSKWFTADTSAFIVVISILAGVTGSKLLYVIENIEQLGRTPFDTIFSPGGLTWYGGFFLVTAILYYFTKKLDIPFLRVCDAAAPALMIGYGIARIGCHLAGDGDYGIPTDLPWGTNYENGTYPPSVAFRDFPEIVSRYGVNGIIPDHIPVHPAPVYEFLAGVLFFFVLWKFRTSFKQNGLLFMMYLIFSGSARLAVEFIRINPRLLFGLTEAQLFSVILIIVGVVGFFVLQKKNNIEIQPSKV